MLLPTVQELLSGHRQYIIYFIHLLYRAIEAI